MPELAFTGDSASVHTVELNNGRFETAVLCKYYSDRDWILVETYDNREQAQYGHDSWIKAMTVPYDLLPEVLIVSSHTLLSALIKRKVYEKKPQSAV